MLIHKISEIKALLLSEASLVAKMLSLAIEGLYDASYCFSTEVAKFEDRVNQIDMEIENKCISLIALQQPECKDLRLILMIYKINNDLARLGEQAVNIAESTCALTEKSSISHLPQLKEMKLETGKMLREAMQAFNSEDVELARKVCRDDNLIDNYNRSIINQLIQMMKSGEAHIEDSLHLMRIARNLERIADLSTNIAESTIYVAEGRVIKHNTDL